MYSRVHKIVELDPKTRYHSKLCGKNVLTHWYTKSLPCILTNQSQNIIVMHLCVNVCKGSSFLPFFVFILASAPEVYFSTSNDQHNI